VKLQGTQTTQQLRDVPAAWGDMCALPALPCPACPALQKWDQDKDGYMAQADVIPMFEHMQKQVGIHCS
jgi:hypothetical protein